MNFDNPQKSILSRENFNFVHIVWKVSKIVALALENVEKGDEEISNP